MGPTELSNGTITVDSNKILTLSTAFKKLGLLIGKKHIGLQMSFTGDAQDPIKISSEDLPGVGGLLMPFRSTEVPNKWILKPKWTRIPMYGSSFILNKEDS